jgi:hypothetical protein
LRQAAYAADTGVLTLYWQTDAALAQDYAIFVHLLDESGQILAQADGVPYNGLYPLRNWQPGQVITDTRPLASLLPETARLKTTTIGLYDPATGQRLPAADASGQTLPDDSFMIPISE